MRGIKIFLTVLILIVPLASFGNEEQSANKFQQYKQDTVLLQQYDNALDDYYNIFPFMNAYNYGYPMYYPRHSHRYSHHNYGYHYANRHHGGFIMPAPFGYNDDSSNFYLKDIPKDTLVNPNEYIFLNEE
ncbi:hypothetical protein IJ182_09185 [bacterium]|nr:hypothetical protein [bacterium]